MIEIRTDAEVLPSEVAAAATRVHHGSSISHSSLAPNPGDTWPAIAAAGLGFAHTNLGFSGNAMLDPFVARTIRDTPADFISIKIGINLINFDVMTTRAFTPALHGFPRHDSGRPAHNPDTAYLTDLVHCS